MKITIEFDPRAGRLDIEYDGGHIPTLGLLELAKSAVLKKGSQGLTANTLMVRKVDE